MNTNIDPNEIDELEKVLNDFKYDFDSIQNSRASKWRLQFLLSFIITIMVLIFFPTMLSLTLPVRYIQCYVSTPERATKLLNTKNNLSWYDYFKILRHRPIPNSPNVL